MANAVSNLAIVLSGNAAPLNAVLTKATRDIHSFTHSANRTGGASGFGGGSLLGGIGGKGGGLLSGMAGGAGGMLSSLGGGAAAGLAAGGVVAAAGTIKDALSGVASLLGKVGSTAISNAADFEMLGTSFEVMTGSADKGRAMLEEIQNLAIATPYETKGLAEAGKMMMGMGVSADNIIPALSRLGDVAMGDKVKFANLALVFSQARSKGRILGDDLNQFATAGIGAEDFAKTMGVLPSEFMKLKEAGEVSFGVVAATVNRLTNAGGRFFEGNLKGSKTVMGQWNALKESVNKSLTGIGLSMFKALDVAPTLGRISDALAPMSTIGDQIAGPLSQVKTIGGDVLAFLQAGWDAAGGAAKNFGGVMDALTPTWGETRDGVRSLLETLIYGLGHAADLLVKLGGAFADHLLMPMTEAVNGFTKSLAMQVAQTANLIDPTGSLGQAALADELSRGADAMGADLLARMARVRPALMDAAEHTNIAATFAASFQRHLEGGARAAQDIAKHMPEIKPGFEIPPKIADFAGKLKTQFATGDTPLAKFQHEMDMIRQAEGFNLLTPQIANRGMAGAFDDLAKHFGKTLETALPKAVMYGSQEAASVISHALNEGTNDPQQRIAQILEIANRNQRMIEKHTADTARSLRNLSLGSKGF